MAPIYFQNLVNDVISRDILVRHNIQHPVQLKMLVHILMNSYSRLITVNKLKQRLAGEQNKLSPELVSDYIEKLKDCYLIDSVPIRSYNTAVQSVNPKKSVPCRSCIGSNLFPFYFGNSGLVLENMVFMALRQVTEQIFYYKTSRGDEIDFAVGPDSAIKLIQVSWSLGKDERTRGRELSPLLDGMEELGLQESWVIAAYEEEQLTDEKTGRIVHIVPAYSWLLQGLCL